MRDYVKLLDWLRSSQNACYIYGCDECPADCENHEGDIFKDAADAIEELVAAVPKWISAEERLPEEDMPVLCYYEYFRYGDYNCMFNSIDRGYFYNGRFGGINGSKLKVKYWMPLPDQPKEVE